MPEGPEVALTALYLNASLKGKSLSSVKIMAGPYKRKKPHGYTSFVKHLPLKIKKIESKGKKLYFEFSNGWFMTNSFGMEGEWGFEEYQYSKFAFKVGRRTLYFTDHRNFGKFKFHDNKADFDNELDKIAPDLLKTKFTEADFHGRIKKVLSRSSKRRNWKIVEVLTNQEENKGIGSGIGNYLVAEILYDAEISPHTKLGDIYENRDMSDRLSKSIKKVLKVAFMDNDIGYMKRNLLKDGRARRPNYHPTTKLKKGTSFEFRVYRQKEDPFGNKVKAERIKKDNRTTYWVPVVQE